MNQKVMFYLNNGDTYMGDDYTEREAVRTLAQKGYHIYYTGRYEYLKRMGTLQVLHSIRVVVAINEHNTVPLERRRQNGLKYAKQKQL